MGFAEAKIHLYISFVDILYIAELGFRKYNLNKRLAFILDCGLFHDLCCGGSHLLSSHSREETGRCLRVICFCVF